MHRLKFILALGVLSLTIWILGREVYRLPQIEDLTARVADVEAQISTPGPLRGGVDSPEAYLTRAGVIKWTNIRRRDNHLSSLAENSRLNAAARAKVDDMFARQFFAHVSPTGEGAADLAANEDYEFIAIGENLALGNFAADEELVQAWMDSPGHRANILGESFSEIGVGVRQGSFEGQSTWLAVQIFARPRSACPGVSESLRSQIDSNQPRLDQWEEEIEALKRELDSMRPRHGEAYNAKVDQYNALVAKFNPLVEATKDLIARYNAQVNEFNACLNE